MMNSVRFLRISADKEHVLERGEVYEQGFLLHSKTFLSKASRKSRLLFFKSHRDTEISHGTLGKEAFILRDLSGPGIAEFILILDIKCR